MLVRCYAKVNLTLEILRRRADGFHDLASLVHTISLADDLHIEPADELLVRTEGLDEPTEGNLVTRAASLLASTCNVRGGARLTLLKRIPVAAGLGGGSSDAAATLVGLNSLWGTRLRPGQLAALAARLGSDVPFFVRGGAALMRGRGDELEAVPPLGRQWLVLVVPPHAVANKTARLYASLEKSDFSAGEATERAARRAVQRQGLDPADLCNGFLRAALQTFPGLAETKAALERVCGRPFFLSGAGPALFCLAGERLLARQLAAQAAAMTPTVFVTHTVRHARAAVSGDPGRAGSRRNRRGLSGTEE